MDSVNDFVCGNNPSSLEILGIYQLLDQSDIKSISEILELIYSEFPAEFIRKSGTDVRPVSYTHLTLPTILLV